MQWHSRPDRWEENSLSRAVICEISLESTFDKQLGNRSFGLVSIRDTWGEVIYHPLKTRRGLQYLTEESRHVSIDIRLRWLRSGPRISDSWKTKIYYSSTVMTHIPARKFVRGILIIYKFGRWKADGWFSSWGEDQFIYILHGRSRNMKSSCSHSKAEHYAHAVASNECKGTRGWGIMYVIMGETHWMQSCFTQLFESKSSMRRQKIAVKYCCSKNCCEDKRMIQQPGYINSSTFLMDVSRTWNHIRNHILFIQEGGNCAHAMEWNQEKGDSTERMWRDGTEITGTKRSIRLCFTQSKVIIWRIVLREE